MVAFVFLAEGHTCGFHTFAHSRERSGVTLLATVLTLIFTCNTVGHMPSRFVMLISNCGTVVNCLLHKTINSEMPQLCSNNHMGALRFKLLGLTFARRVL